MKHIYNKTNQDALFAVTDNLSRDLGSFPQNRGLINFLWNRNQYPLRLYVDGLGIELQPNQLTTVTYFHQLELLKNEAPVTAILFNKPFYCVVDHDKEVGCNGILFFGAQNLPVITIPEDQQKKFNLLWDVMIEEFSTNDNIQGEMLQMLLKRFIIISTRLAKQQIISASLHSSQIDIIRQFNVLVDMHYKTKRKVKDYAALLNKSPKTLSNLFAIYNHKPPQQIIQERVVLQAKRMMEFTDKHTQEIAFELGFDDPAHFTRFFKKQTGFTPSDYKGHLKQ